MKDKRINGSALECIMRDVLEGMQDLTREVSAGSAAGELTVLSVENPACEPTPIGRIIPFPASRNRGK